MLGEAFKKSEASCASALCFSQALESNNVALGEESISACLRYAD